TTCLTITTLCRERLARCTAPAALPSPLLPPPLHMPPLVDHRDDIPETKMPPRKRLCFSTLGSRYEVEESSTARPTGGRGIDYRIAHQETIQIMEDEAYAAREAWAHLIGLSQAVHSELQTHQDRGKLDSQEGMLESPTIRMLLGMLIVTSMGRQIMAPVTRQGPNTLPNNTNLNNMTPEFVQAMIDQALL
nr:hypothetical protein [Tanacetum cinerariifolium]